jgi:four helix bundle protein
VRKAKKTSAVLLRCTYYFLLSDLVSEERAVAFDFEELLVYQKAVDFADQICAHTERFQRGYGFLVDQLNRAALSISANIAQGNGRFTKADRRNFFGIVRGSTQECVPLLELARRRELLTTEQHTSLKEHLEEIARMLSGLIKGIENRA